MQKEHTSQPVPQSQAEIEKQLFGDTPPKDRFDEASRKAFLNTVDYYMRDGGQFRKLK